MGSAVQQSKTEAANETCVYAGTFVAEFLEFFLQGRKYEQLKLSDGHVASARGILGEEGITGVIPDNQDDSDPYFIYNFFPVGQEEQTRRADVLLNWRLDVQRAADAMLVLPYREQPLNFVFFEERPRNNKGLERLLLSQRPDDLHIKVCDQGASIRMWKRFSMGDAVYKRENTYLHLGGFSQQTGTYQVYGNNPDLDEQVARLSIPSLAGYIWDQVTARGAK